jgi:hypothetical protein
LSDSRYVHVEAQFAALPKTGFRRSSFTPPLTTKIRRNFRKSMSAILPAA